MNDLVFIPARAGSKGIKNKNLVKINDKPLILHTIDFIKNFPNLMWFVSTNGKKIFDISKKNGFRFKYLRPSKLSNSKSRVCDAVFDAHDWLKKNHNLNFKNIILLQPTSPMRKKRFFKKAYKLFKKKLKSLASVTIMREFPEECVEIKSNKKNFLKKQKTKTLLVGKIFQKNFFFIDGSFYIIDYNFLKNTKICCRKSNFFYKLKSRWPIDIDQLDDLKVASALMKK